jgi:hypothetical protein
MTTIDEMLDNAFNKPLIQQPSYEEWLVLHEAGKKGTLEFKPYVCPQEYAQQYLSKSRQTFFTKNHTPKEGE